jgi:anti-sigma factor RsiW
MSADPQIECTAILANISAYLDGELDSSSCAAIEAHCATCAYCAPVVQGLQRTIGLCHQAAHAPLPEDVRSRAQESVRRLLDSRRGGRA